MYLRHLKNREVVKSETESRMPVSKATLSNTAILHQKDLFPSIFQVQQVTDSLTKKLIYKLYM